MRKLRLKWNYEIKNNNKLFLYYFLMPLFQEKCIIMEWKFFAIVVKEGVSITFSLFISFISIFRFILNILYYGEVKAKKLNLQAQLQRFEQVKW